MHWTEPATSDDAHAALEKKLWDAANQLWGERGGAHQSYTPPSIVWLNLAVNGLSGESVYLRRRAVGFD